MNRFAIPIVFFISLMASGCGSRTPSNISAVTNSKNVESSLPSSALERVCKIVSEQMGVPLASVTPKTSLGDLSADELDFVELIMELEESFSITISDAKADTLTGNQGGQKGIDKVTIEKLSELVIDLSK